MKRKGLIAILITSIFITSCICLDPFSIIKNANRSKLAIYDLLEFVPNGVATSHPQAIVGSVIFYLDFDRMNQGLDFPEAHSKDPWSEKSRWLRRDLHQGLKPVPEEIRIYAESAYETYGWDFTDISQSIYILNYETAVLKGDFDIKKIAEVNEDKGYITGKDGRFDIYQAKAAGEFSFAVSSDYSILSNNYENVSYSILQKKNTATSMACDQDVKKLIEQTDDPFGYVFVSSGNITDLAITGDYPAEYIPYLANLGAYQYDWDMMLISYVTEDKETALDINYLFSSEDLAIFTKPIIENTMTTTTYLIYPDYPDWSEVMPLTSIDQVDNEVLLTAKTQINDFLGPAFLYGNFYGFFPATKTTDDL